MAEQWAAIVGHEGAYEVSSTGRVRSLNRELTYPNGKVFRKKGRELKLAKCSNAYLAVNLGRDNRYLVHRLVASAFLGAHPHMQVNHKNGDRTDNRLENLEWVTCSENHKHSYAALSRKKHSKTREVEMGGDRYESCSAAALAYGLSPGSVSSAALRNHKCLGMEVRYV